MGKLFDIYLAVDWSARSAPSPARPHKDALWWACQARQGPPEIGYARTRHACEARLLTLFQQWQADGLRVLAGFDFSFGYPAGFARAARFPGSEAPWLRTWNWLASTLTDDVRNANNRFAVAARLNARTGPGQGPFWGCPAAQVGPHLGRKRHPQGFPFPVDTGDTLARLRHSEAGTPGVQSVWKLLGIGSVGSQSLTGIPVLQRLRAACSPDLAVWPFETGFEATPVAQIVLAEIWPSSLSPYLPHAPAEITDRLQVRTAVARMAELDAAGQLANRFSLPKNIPQTAVESILAEEGCILPLK